jgi:hypothetical protein
MKTIILSFNEMYQIVTINILYSSLTHSINQGCIVIQDTHSILD